MPEHELRAELVGKRPHRLVLRAGGDPQALVALGTRFRDQLAEQDTADTPPAHRPLDAERDLGKRIRRLVRRMQFGRAANHAVLEKGDDGRAVIGAFLGVALDEAVVHEAMETVAAAVAVEPQQVIAQQRQFFLLAQRADAGIGERSRNVREVHGLTPLREPSRRRRIP